MKIIFLDIDGVLNSNDSVIYFCEKLGLPNPPRDEYGELFCPFASNLLNKLIKETDAKIVISSTWRLSGLVAMQEMWKFRNMEGEVIDVTPYLPYIGNIDNWNINRSCPRGWEIENWLNQRGFRYNKYPFDNEDKVDITNHVILDDDCDFMMYQKDNFIHVNNLYGFTKDDYNKAYEILTK